MAALSIDYRETVIARIQREPEFARALLEDVINMTANGEAAEARETLRMLVHASGGFESMAERTHINAKSLHRMLGPKGNPAFSAVSTVMAEISQSILHARASIQLEAAT
ncbi:MAG TPA: transcriptional regulator [Luteibacter sp.]|jgi:DNA-binding phage protein|nr:transcriptional regulator [Luteibacter sp.]